MSGQKCRYSVEYGGSSAGIVMSCRDCGGAAKLEDRECLASTVDWLSVTYGIGRVKLGDFQETEYRGRSVELLSMYAGILAAMDELAGKSATAGKACAKCEASPGRLWPGLARAYRADLSDFEREVDAGFELLDQPGAGEGCKGCREGARSDLEYVLGQVRTLASGIMFAAYRMIV